MGDMEKAIAGVGAAAEMSLVYFRTAIGAGATLEEAITLTRIYLEAQFAEAARQKKEQENAEMEE